VTHVSGLPRHDALWYCRSYDRASLFSRLRHLEPSTSFRGRYQYQNLMFMTAGYLVEALTDEPWDARIDQRIFTPLGMTRSNTSVRDLHPDDDVALPYYLDGDSLVRVPYRNIDAIGPAGSINSSVEEMLAYVQMHLDSGLAGDVRILSADQIAMMQTAQSAVGSRDRYPELGPATYGLALRLGTYRGHKMAGHGGGIDGFISSMIWLPNERIGVVVLTNRSGDANPVPTIVQQRVLDELLGLDPIDWNARIRAEWEEGRAREAEARAKREAERVPGTAPSHALADYAGTYDHPGYGRVEVVAHDGALRIRWDGDEVPLAHYHYDVFEVSHAGPNTPLEGRLQFLMGMDGTVDRLVVPLEPAVDPIVFRRVPAP
ncbi:MAG: serine hydrolase, partial [Synechococcaceae cyanobacterium]|nr:serine hydrolase [Synechococcaceae cyanobacterium]